MVWKSKNSLTMKLLASSLFLLGFYAVVCQCQTTQSEVSELRSDSNAERQRHTLVVVKPTQILREQKSKCRCRPGAPGRPGKPGIKGNLGLKGQPGAQGESGRNGVDGSPGPNGSPGYGGHKGHNGHDGYPGEPGPRGPPGRDGYPGTPGRPGNKPYPVFPFLPFPFPHYYPWPDQDTTAEIISNSTEAEPTLGTF